MKEKSTHPHEDDVDGAQVGDGSDPDESERPRSPRARLDALIAELRAFVREECLPLEASIDREDAIPEAMVERMRALGLFGHSIPEAYGGAGLTTGTD